MLIRLSADQRIADTPAFNTLMPQLGRGARRIPARQKKQTLDLAPMERLNMPATLSRSNTMQRFNVQGMSCGHCVRAITQAVQSSDPAADVQVDLTSGEVRVESTLSAEAIVSLISTEGYAVHVV
jgi:copper chaperone